MAATNAIKYPAKSGKDTAIGCDKDPPGLLDGRTTMFCQSQHRPSAPSPDPRACAFYRNRTYATESRKWWDEVCDIAALCAKSGCTRCKKSPLASLICADITRIFDEAISRICNLHICTHPLSPELSPKAHRHLPSLADANGLFATEHPEPSIPSPAPAPLPAEPVHSAPIATMHEHEDTSLALLCSNPPSSPCFDSLPSPAAAASGHQLGSVPAWRQRLSPPPNINSIDHYRKMGWLRDCRSLEDRCNELEAHHHNRQWQRRSATANLKSGGAIPISGGAEFAHWYRPPPIYRLKSFYSLMRRNVRLHPTHPCTLL